MKKLLKTPSMAFCLLMAVMFTVSSMAQKVTLKKHQKLNQDALWFWYSNPNKRAFFYNRNISPKGDCIQVINGYVFFTWYKGGMDKRNLMLSRLKISTNKWKHIEFPDKNTLMKGERLGQNVNGAGNSHQTASVGVSPIDGTIHLAYDMHGGQLKYRISKKNIAFASDDKFKVSNFSSRRNYFRSGEKITSFTYPKFEVSSEGKLLVEYRRGATRSGDRYMVLYNGKEWSKPKLVVKGRNEKPQFNQYGLFNNYFGKMYFSCAVRIGNDPVKFNQGFFFADTGINGDKKWKNLKGNSFNVPIEGMQQMNKFKVASPLPKGHQGMTAAPKMVVSKNGAVHISNQVKGTGVVHYFSQPGGTTMKRASGKSPDVSFPGNDGRVYSIGLAAGKIKLQSTPEGKSNWRTDYEWNGSQRFGLMQYDFTGDKVYVIATEKRDSDKLPLHYFEIDLGSKSSPNKKPNVSFVKPSNNVSVNVGYKLNVEVKATDPDGSIKNVKLYINNSLIRQESKVPYEWGHEGEFLNELNGRKAGTYTVKAVATDNKGATAEATFKLTVKGGTNPDPDPDPNPNNNCKFGTPRNSGIPSLDKVAYNNFYKVGSGGPSLGNFRKFTINWNSGSNGLYQFAINTNNGTPNWYVDLTGSMSFKMKNAKPEVSLSNTGFSGLDGSYWVNTTSNSFILVSKSGNFSLHFSNASKGPSCSNKNNEQLVDEVLSVDQNPFTDILTISGLGENAINISLFDVHGKQIVNTAIEKGSSSISLNTQGIARGMYFVKVLSESDNYLKTLKVIKE